MGERAAIACMLGGPEARTLFLLSNIGANPKHLVETKTARVGVVTVETPGAGLP
jgi:sugar lactone lactonase YvrE